MHLQTTKSIKVANPIFLQFTMQGFVWNKFLFATKFILKARTKLIKPVNFFNVKCIWFSIWTSLIICLNFRLRIYIGSLDQNNISCEIYKIIDYAGTLELNLSFEYR